jgi:hypothetical protein
MAAGLKARNPTTPYVVYEFSVGERVYYVGVGQKNSTRATDRWNYIAKQLERLKREGTLPPAKMRDISKPSGAVIRAMIENGMKPHVVNYCWEGPGRTEALRQEALRIKLQLARGCVLANVAGNTRPATVASPRS